MCRLVGLNTYDGTQIDVASIKMDAIKNIIESASLCPNIDAIVLFGFSLEERCTSDSDIDIAIISKKTVSDLCRLKSFKRFMDMVYLFDMGQDISTIVI